MLETHAPEINIFDKTVLVNLGYPNIEKWWGPADKYVYEFSKIKLLEIARETPLAGAGGA